MKTIHIPKIEGEYYRVRFYKSKCRKYTLVLKEQEIAGLVIPKNTEINIDVEEYLLYNHYPYDEIEIPVYYVNRMLKFIYLEKLRNGK